MTTPCCGHQVVLHYADPAPTTSAAVGERTGGCLATGHDPSGSGRPVRCWCNGMPEGQPLDVRILLARKGWELYRDRLLSLREQGMTGRAYADLLSGLLAEAGGRIASLEEAVQVEIELRLGDVDVPEVGELVCWAPGQATRWHERRYGVVETVDDPEAVRVVWRNPAVNAEGIEWLPAEDLLRVAAGIPADQVHSVCTHCGKPLDEGRYPLGDGEPDDKYCPSAPGAGMQHEEHPPSLKSVVPAT